MNLEVKQMAKYQKKDMTRVRLGNEVGPTPAVAENHTSPSSRMIIERSLTPEQIEVQSVKNEKGSVFISFPTGRRIRFCSILIPHEDVEAITVVDEFNPRMQSCLNNESTSDISGSIASNGVVYSVWAEYCPDGRYKLIDGSRRRHVAIHGGKPLPVLYTDEVLTGLEKIFLIYSGTLSKSFSLYEKGRMMSLFQEESGLGIKECCANFGIDKSTYHRQINAYKLIPMSVYNLFKSGIDLKVNDVRNLITSINKIKECDYGLIERLDSMAKEMSPFKTDKEAMKWITSVEESFTGQSHKPKRKDKPVVINERVIGNIEIKQFPDGISISHSGDFDFDKFCKMMSEQFVQK